MEKLSVFEINVIRTDGGEWQGTIKFSDSGEERAFYNFLELLKVLEEKDDCFENVKEQWKNAKFV